MNKITALFFMSLILCCMLTHSARPEPSSQQESLVVAQHEDVEAVDTTCEGIEEDECLMRRTLIAHTDYIYTQKHNP
ncbi:unnamed protein product [Lathyrus sativus]|nr:unnamed protein product [Lathyrus sativus]